MCKKTRPKRISYGYVCRHASVCRYSLAWETGQEVFFGDKWREIPRMTRLPGSSSPCWATNFTQKHMSSCSRFTTGVLMMIPTSTLTVSQSPCTTLTAGKFACRYGCARRLSLNNAGNSHRSLVSMVHCSLPIIQCRWRVPKFIFGSADHTASDAANWKPYFILHSQSWGHQAC